MGPGLLVVFLRPGRCRSPPLRIEQRSISSDRRRLVKLCAGGGVGRRPLQCVSTPRIVGASAGSAQASQTATRNGMTPSAG